MKIRTQFIISTAFFLIILVIISTSALLISQKVEETQMQAEIARSIEREAYELSYLSNDYLLYRESQQASRWESKFNSYYGNLSSLRVFTSEQQALVNNINTNQKLLKDVFTEVRAAIEKPGQGAAAEPQFMQISWSRMAVQNQGMIFDAGRLSHMLLNQVEDLRQMRIMLLYVVLGVFGGFLLSNYLLTYRRTLKGISLLQAGTRIIGSGNLEHRVGMTRTDELGELARSFDHMTQRLQALTVSKEALQNEVEQRKKVQEELDQHRLHLEKLVSERTAELESTNRSLNEEVRLRTLLEDELRALSDRLIALQEEERRSLARELHDNTGASLALVKLMLDKAQTLPLDKALTMLDEVKVQVGNVIKQVRNLSLELRPGMLDNLGLQPALEWLIDQYRSRTGIDIHFETQNLESSFSQEISTAAYRILQEAMTNIVRHSRAKKVTVKAGIENKSLFLSVEDNGSGFDMSQLDTIKSTGLSSMKERARLLGGGFRIESTPGKGTRIFAELPLSTLAEK